MPSATRRMPLSIASPVSSESQRAVPFSTARSGDLVLRRAGLGHRHADHAGLHRVDVARHDRLQGDDAMPGAEHRVARQVRQRGMAGMALEGDLEARAGGHHRRAHAPQRSRPRAPASCASRRSAPSGSGRTARRRSSPGRRRRPPRPAGRPVAPCRPSPCRRQQRRGAEQRGGMAVMAAGMHHAGNGGAVRQVRVHLLDRQRVHVAAQPDRAVAAFPARRMVPTTPWPPTPSVTSTPSSRNRAATKAAVSPSCRVRPGWACK